MGDLRDWLSEPETLTAEERPSSSFAAPEHRGPGIGDEYWNRAEDATQGIIARVQPKVVSEKRRRAVIEFVQRLLKGYLGCEVFPFGSVPLKTYLPDGDIDLTAFGGINVEEALASDVCSVLEREEHNNAAEFVVKDVQLIRAEVKLVKCLVQNIVVDISFNQLGGLCTLCFLEQVDCLIGKDHLFKRSIILIKAWCYYESRILGAHHGLISTYALETLVLYIFHLFHSSLNGPLAVLYKFLDYFSSFDWDNYCISLNGPVRISCLPELIAEVPESNGHGLLLSDDFLKGCVETFSAPSRGYEAASRTFSPKHLNIVDPLKENNNLGRSVSKGNFFRIRSAFSFGARKLRSILSLPEESIVDEIQNFFSNTMERHGKGQRPDVQDPLFMCRHDDFGVPPFLSDTESPEMHTVHEANYPSHAGWECGPQHRGLPNGGVTDAEILETEEIRSDRSMNGNAITDNRLNGDAKDLATLRLQNLTIDIPKESSPSQHSPHSLLENGETKYDDPMENREVYDYLEVNVASDREENRLVNDHKGLGSVISSAEDYHPGISELCHKLSDLSGDYESHLSSLQYGRWCYDCALSPPVLPVPPLLALHKKRSWEFLRRSLQLKHHMSSQVNPNGIVHRPPFFHLSPPLLPGGGGFGIEEMPKPRGTGTYIPNMNHYRDRPLTPRGRNQSQLRSPRNNGRLVIPPPENSFLERNNREVAAHMTISPHNGSRGKSASFDDLYCSPRRMAEQNVDGLLHGAEHFVEPGPNGHFPPEPPLLRGRWQTSIGSSPIQNPSASLSLPGSENLKSPPRSLDTDRVDVQSYRLKDEDDFPPLSV